MRPLTSYDVELMCRAERIAIRNEAAKKPTETQRLNAHLDKVAILSGLIFIAVLVLR